MNYSNCGILTATVLKARDCLKNSQVTGVEDDDGTYLPAEVRRNKSFLNGGQFFVETKFRFYVRW